MNTDEFLRDSLLKAFCQVDDDPQENDQPLLPDQLLLPDQPLLPDLQWPKLVSPDQDHLRDVTVISAEKESILCHKLCLVTISPVFSAMFKNEGTKESMENVVNLADTEAETIR